MFERLLHMSFFLACKKGWEGMCVRICGRFHACVCVWGIESLKYHSSDRQCHLGSQQHGTKGQEGNKTDKWTCRSHTHTHAHAHTHACSSYLPLDRLHSRFANSKRFVGSFLQLLHITWECVVLFTSGWPGSPSLVGMCYSTVHDAGHRPCSYWAKRHREHLSSQDD